MAYVCCITGVLEAEFYEADVEVIPITFPFATSHIWWPINQPDRLNIKFDFRSNRTTAVLAYGEVTTSEGNGFWEVNAIIFVVVVLLINKTHTAVCGIAIGMKIFDIKYIGNSHEG